MNTITPEMYRAVEQQRDEARAELQNTREDVAVLLCNIALMRKWLADKRQDEYEHGSQYGYKACKDIQAEFGMRFPQ